MRGLGLGKREGREKGEKERKKKAKRTQGVDF
jgi:hypothetical protein